MDRYEAFESEWALGEAARCAGNPELAEHHYSRAHILGQPIIRLHLKTHAALLSLYVSHRRWRDAWGQFYRFLLVIPGTWIHRLPAGNSGLSSVSAFKPMSAPADFARFMENSPSDPPSKT